MKRRFRVFCRTCGEIEADTDDGMYDKTTAYRRAGFHEGLHDGEHTCSVEVGEETNEYQCPICHTTVTGKRERDRHASKEPGLQPDSMMRV